jgi:hypothetical protein
VRRSIGLLVVPVVAVVALWARRVDRLQNGPDAGVFIGMVRNLRASLSLTTPTDQFWIRLSPAETVTHLGRIPVPDFGPVYAAVVAAVPLPLDLAFLVVHAVALLVAVGAVGLLAARATGSTVAGAAAQVLALWGPFAPDVFFSEGRPLDLFAMIGSDGVAVACFLAGLVLVTADRRSRAADVGAAAGLAASILTRYALAGAVAGVLAGLLRARRARGDRRWVLPAAALAAGAAWVVVLAPLLVGGAAAKGLVVHRGALAPLGTTLAGWVGVDVTGPWAAALVVGLVAVLLVVGVAGAPGSVTSLTALAAVGHLVVVVAGRQLLDAGLNLREERHVLLVRFLLAVLVVRGVVLLVTRWRGERAAPAAVATLAVVGVLAAGGWPGPRALAPRPMALAVDDWLAAQGDLPVLSNESDLWYQQTGVPAADLPRGGESTTGRARDVDAEVAALAGRAGAVVQAYRSGLLDTVDLRALPCARVAATSGDADLDGFELAVVDLTGCRD